MGIYPPAAELSATPAMLSIAVDRPPDARLRRDATAGRAGPPSKAGPTTGGRSDAPRGLGATIGAVRMFSRTSCPRATMMLPGSRAASARATSDTHSDADVVL